MNLRGTEKNFKHRRLFLDGATVTHLCDYTSRGNVHVTPLSAWLKTRCGERGETPDNDYHHSTTGDVSFVGLSPPALALLVVAPFTALSTTAQCRPSSRVSIPCSLPFPHLLQTTTPSILT